MCSYSVDSILFPSSSFIVAGKQRKSFPLHIECSDSDEAAELLLRLGSMFRILAAINDMSKILGIIASSTCWSTEAAWFTGQHGDGFYVALYASRIGIFTNKYVRAFYD